MKTVNVNGIILTKEAINELYYLQTGSSLESPSKPNNSGLAFRIEAVDNLTSFIIEKADFIDEDPKLLLDFLSDLNYLRKSFKRLSVPQKMEESHGN